MTTWMRCYWDEEDVWFYFEVDVDGWVARQVELQGPALREHLISVHADRGGMSVSVRQVGVDSPVSSR
ncbi:hypothetical protein ABZT01_37200, partial [Streptomyces sp. NPDC005345]